MAPGTVPPMADDWRLRITFQGDSRADELRERLEATDLEHTLEQRFHRRVAISADDDEVFAYAGTREQAEARRRAGAQRRPTQLGWQVELELRRWHPTAEDWEDPDKPLPSTDAREGGRARGADRARARGVDRAPGTPSSRSASSSTHHHAAVGFADQLEREGFVVVRRWHFLIVGAPDEDSANALAERIRQEAPAGAVVNSEGTQRTVSEGSGGNPFAYFGGLGG